MTNLNEIQSMIEDLTLRVMVLESKTGSQESALSALDEETDALDARLSALEVQ